MMRGWVRCVLWGILILSRSHWRARGARGERSVEGVGKRPRVGPEARLESTYTSDWEYMDADDSDSGGPLLPVQFEWASHLHPSLPPLASGPWRVRSERTIAGPLGRTYAIPGAAIVDVDIQKQWAPYTYIEAPVVRRKEWLEVPTNFEASPKF